MEPYEVLIIILVPVIAIAIGIGIALSIRNDYKKYSSSRMVMPDIISGEVPQVKSSVPTSNRRQFELEDWTRPSSVNYGYS